MLFFVIYLSLIIFNNLIFNAMLNIISMLLSICVSFIKTKVYVVYFQYFLVLSVVIQSVYKFYKPKFYMLNFNFGFTLGSSLTKFSILFLVSYRYWIKLLLIFKPYLYPLKWKPLFKKSSYFGIYRSTRNQFFNK